MQSTPASPSATAKYAKDVNAYVSEYIRFADLKAGAIVTLATAIAAALGKAAAPVVAATATSSTAVKWSALVLFVGAAVALALVVYSALDAFSPRTPSSGNSPSKESLNSFPDVAKKDPDTYASEISALTELQMAEHLSRHNVTLSKIAMAKFQAIKRASFWLLLMGGVAFLVIVMYVFALHYPKA